MLDRVGLQGGKNQVLERDAFIRLFFLELREIPGLISSVIFGLKVCLSQFSGDRADLVVIKGSTGT